MSRGNPDLDIPSDLSGDGTRAATVVRGFLLKRRLTHTGGCVTFYSPAAWEKRWPGDYKGAVLILCHEGSALSYIMNPYMGGNPKRLEEQLKELERRLEAAGFWLQSLNVVSTAVYPVETPIMLALGDIRATVTGWARIASGHDVFALVPFADLESLVRRIDAAIDLAQAPRAS